MYYVIAEEMWEGQIRWFNVKPYNVEVECGKYEEIS